MGLGNLNTGAGSDESFMQEPTNQENLTIPHEFGPELPEGEAEWMLAHADPDSIQRLSASMEDGASMEEELSFVVIEGSGWPGLPTLDVYPSTEASNENEGAVLVAPFTDDEIFIGSDGRAYDRVAVRMMDAWPRTISTVWQSKPHSHSHAEYQVLIQEGEVSSMHRWGVFFAGQGEEPYQPLERSPSALLLDGVGGIHVLVGEQTVHRFDTELVVEQGSVIRIKANVDEGKVSFEVLSNGFEFMDLLEPFTHRPLKDEEMVKAKKGGFVKSAFVDLSSIWGDGDERNCRFGSNVYGPLRARLTLDG